MKKLNREILIDRFLKTHGSYYDYHMFQEYSGNVFDKIPIICPVHGIFNQSAKGHFSGRGCRKCGIKRSADKQRSSTEEFIKKSIKVHGDRYSYEDSKYGKRAGDKIFIICKLHGKFRQSPNKHLQGRGCPKCGNYDGRFPKEHAERNKEEYLNIESGIYLINLSSKNENFFKVGISRNFKSRYTSIPYNVTPIIEEKIPLYWAMLLEQYVHSFCKDYSYAPSISFCGKTECFNISQLKITELLLKIRLQWL